MENQPSLIGRGRTEGSALFRRWFAELDRAAEQGEHTAYVFVMGSMAEILRCFDFHLTFPEITSLQTAVRRVSMDLINRAEDYGYSPDICSYVKADVGVHLDPERRHPSLRIPRPTLVIATNMCNTYIKWAEIWERLYGVPVFTFDLPGMRHHGYAPEPGTPEFEQDRRYVQGQLTELIEWCERITGKRLDMDRLLAVMDRTNRLAAAWRDVVELNKARPAPFNVMSDGLTYQGMVNAFRGTEEGVLYFEHLREELQEMVRRGLGSLPEEKYRLIFVGTWCYVAFRRFVEMFEEWGGTFVNSEYLSYAGGGLDQGIQYDLSRPLESLAEQMVWTAHRRLSKTFFAHDEMGRMARDWGADGVVYHAVKSCRTVSTVLADSREHLIHNWGIPSLALESDLVDPRCWSEAQMKNRIDAFFEALAARKLAAAGR